jgi:hypothetical protein
VEIENGEMEKIAGEQEIQVKYQGGTGIHILRILPK